MHGELVVMGGSSYPAFTRAVCHLLGIPAEMMTVKRFVNDNLMVQAENNVRGKDVFYIQTSCPPVNDHIMEMMLTIDALRYASAERITAVIPYFPYVRSDKKDKPRISIAARLIADMLQTAGADRVLTMDLHSAQIEGFFHIPVDHLRAINALTTALSVEDLTDYVVVASDIGEAKEAAPFANKLDLPIAVIDKRRTGEDDDRSYVSSMVGDIVGKHCLLIDDETATAETLCNAAHFLMEHEAASVEAVVTHPVLEGEAVERLEMSPIRRVLVADTIPTMKKQSRGSKLHLVTVTEVFADAIQRIHSEAPLSPLFD